MIKLQALVRNNLRYNTERFEPTMYMVICTVQYMIYALVEH